MRTFCHDAVLAQERGPLEALCYADVLECNDCTGPESAARRQSHAGRQRGVAHHAGLPADASPDQQVIRLGAMLQNLGPLDPEAHGGMGCSLCQQGVEVEILLERADAERGDEGLSLSSAGLCCRRDVMMFHGEPPGQKF